VDNVVSFNSSYFNSILYRRQVDLIIIFVGSTTRQEIMRQQLLSLHLFSDISDVSSIVGWRATEDIYNCKDGSTVCIKDAELYSTLTKTARNALLSDSSIVAYKDLMPSSNINERKHQPGGKEAGWSCAQRRPIRSLAHVLKIFIPKFILIVDDDTYVNVPLLKALLLCDNNYKKSSSLNNQSFADWALSQALYNLPDIGYIGQLGKKLRHRDIPHALGEFMAFGQITTRGFFSGGAGYLIGPPVIKVCH
jgi:hypothetical protein